MAADITPVFAAYFARNLGPVSGDRVSRQAPDYGVSAELRESTIDLTLTFHSESPYCCYEPGCHLSLSDGRRWEWLRCELAALGLPPASRLELRLMVVVEAGAMFFDYLRPEPSPSGHCWYAFAPEPARRFAIVLREGGEEVV